MKKAYITWNPNNKTAALVQQAEAIIGEYEAAGYTLTVRQLYYQFVARDIIENSERSYKSLVGIITKARMAGMLSWLAIEDRSRHHNAFWFDEDELNPVKDLPRYIRFDQWARQKSYVEVWVEKEALGNVVARACEPFFVPHMACKGYLSASEAWRAGRRFREKAMEGKECKLIHLGDHDPSGIDMTRDNRDRPSLFMKMPFTLQVTRLALNMDQIEEYGPPPNPAKVTDSRARSYIKKFGATSWELDALDPRTLEELIQTEFKQYIDEQIWEDVNDEQEEKRSMLERVSERWDEIYPIIQK